MEEPIFSKPKVTIDLDEYLGLIKENERLSKKYENAEVDVLRVIAGTAMKLLPKEVNRSIDEYITYNKHYNIAYHRGSNIEEPVMFSDRIILQKIK